MERSQKFLHDQEARSGFTRTSSPKHTTMQESNPVLDDSSATTSQMHLQANHFSHIMPTSSTSSSSFTTSTSCKDPTRAPANSSQTSPSPCPPATAAATSSASTHLNTPSRSSSSTNLPRCAAASAPSPAIACTSSTRADLPGFPLMKNQMKMSSEERSGNRAARVSSPNKNIASTSSTTIPSTFSSSAVFASAPTTPLECTTNPLLYPFKTPQPQTLSAASSSWLMSKSLTSTKDHIALRNNQPLPLLTSSTTRNFSDKRTTTGTSTGLVDNLNLFSSSGTRGLRLHSGCDSSFASTFLSDTYNATSVLADRDRTRSSGGLRDQRKHITSQLSSHVGGASAHVATTREHKSRLRHYFSDGYASLEGPCLHSHDSAIRALSSASTSGEVLLGKSGRPRCGISSALRRVHSDADPRPASSFLEGNSRSFAREEGFSRYR
ncbi:unnamed protein product [Amoebophrya sp. A25]|nr:unnamed protein product [Amoebophrya sp. A25]|eukprot:GSA25T00013493001.1